MQSVLELSKCSGSNVSLISVYKLNFIHTADELSVCHLLLINIHPLGSFLPCRCTAPSQTTEFTTRSGIEILAVSAWRVTDHSSSELL